MTLAEDERLKDPINACLPPKGNIHITYYEELLTGDLVRLGYEKDGFFLVTNVSQWEDFHANRVWVIVNLLHVGQPTQVQPVHMPLKTQITGGWDVIRDDFLIRAKSYYP